MPIEYHVRPEHNLAILLHVGTVPDDQFLTFYKSLFGGDQLDKSMNLLIDLRQTDSSPRSSEVLRRFAEFVQVQFTDPAVSPKVAVVAPKDISFGLARMYEAFAKSVPWDFVVFRDMDAALEWLRVPGDLMNNFDQDALPEN